MCNLEISGKLCAYRPIEQCRFVATEHKIHANKRYKFYPCGVHPVALLIRILPKYIQTDRIEIKK
jgi:hypothetical protein